MGQPAATPGKRVRGIRVVARAGGLLTADAVVARNRIRELELFLPLTMISAGAAEDMVGGWTALFGVAWALTLSLFLFFNRDRMRRGDLIAGTWVVMVRRARLDRDIAGADAAQAHVFTVSDLAVYGFYELKEREQGLGTSAARSKRRVAASNK